MRSRSDLGSIPRTPAVYALMGGHGRRAYVAYVGIAKNFHCRINNICSFVTAA